MDKIKFSERLELQELKELIDNIYIYPNRAIIETLLKFKQILKNHINKDVSFSEDQIKYYSNIIDNPELLHKDEDDEKEKKEEEKTYEFTFLDDDDDEYKLRRFIPEVTVNEAEKKLINKDYPDYPCINSILVNKNFMLLANKLSFY